MGKVQGNLSKVAAGRQARPFRSGGLILVDRGLACNGVMEEPKFERFRKRDPDENGQAQPRQRRNPGLLGALPPGCRRIRGLFQRRDDVAIEIKDGQSPEDCKSRGDRSAVRPAGERGVDGKEPGEKSQYPGCKDGSSNAFVLCLSVGYG